MTTAPVNVEFTNNILGAMVGILNQDQLIKLKEAIMTQFDKYWIATKCCIVNSFDLNNAAYLDAYINHMLQQGYSENTATLYRYRVMILFSVIQVPVSEMTIYHLRDFLNYFKDVRGVSNVTLDGVRKNIKSFFTWLEREDIIFKNPTLKLDRIKYVQKVKRPFDTVDLSKIRDACKNVRDRAMVETLFCTGLRISEFVQLNRDVVSNKQAVIVGKGGVERVVFLSEVALYYIGEYLKTRTDDNPALFVSFGKPHHRVHKNGIEGRLRILGEQIGMHITPHIFRRSLCSNLLKLNMPLEKVQKILGHKKAETTLSNYYYTNSEDLRNEYSKYISTF